MNDILDEVLNDEKDEKRLILFQRALPQIITATIFIAIVITAYGWYNNKIIRRNKELGDIFIELVSSETGSEKNSETGNEAVINSSLQQISTTKESRQSELAGLQIIHNAIGKNDFIEAIKLLDEVIANKNYLEVTTSYARLLWLSLILDRDKLSDTEQKTAKKYLEHFAKDDQLFFANASILKSLFYKKIGQIEEATRCAESVLKLEKSTILIKEQAIAILASLKNKR